MAAHIVRINGEFLSGVQCCEWDKSTRVARLTFRPAAWLQGEYDDGCIETHIETTHNGQLTQAIRTAMEGE